MTLSDVLQRLRELDEESERRRFLHQSLGATTTEELLPALKAESERYMNIDPHAALRLSEALLCASDLTGQPDHLALGLMAKGDALLRLGQYQRSVDLFEEAGQAFLVRGDEVGWARTRLGWIYSSQCLGRGTEALEVLEPAHDALVRHQEWLRAATLDSNAAYVCYELGRYDQALGLCKRALEKYESHGGPADEVRVAWVKGNQAITLTMLGDFRAALALHAEAREIFVRHDQPVSALREDQNIALVYDGQGHYTRALRLYDDTLAAMEAAHLDADAGWVALNMVECYLDLNRNAEALELAEETVGRFERCGTPTGAARARLYCALAHARLGGFERALPLLADAARTFAEAGLAGQVAIATLERARLHLESADYGSALAEAERAGALFAERGLAVRQPEAEILRARAALGLGRHEEAATLARSALASMRERDALRLEHECHHVLTDVARERGDLEAALRECQAGIASVERVQGWLATELRSSFLADKLRIYQDAIDLCLGLDRPELAFEYLERAKSRALVDYLAGNVDVRIRARNGASRELVDELARLREEHNWFYSRLYGYGLAQRPEAGSPDAEHLQAAIRDRERRIARVLERLTLHRAEGLEELFSPPADLRAGPPPLDDDTALLEYCFWEDGGAVFVATSEVLSVVPLDARPEAIRRLLSAWQLNLDAAAAAIRDDGRLAALGRNARGILRALYCELIEPAAAHLAGRSRLVVVPYGPTHWVPFHALHDGERHLLEAVEVSACPSSSLLRLCASRARRAQRTALVVAHSDGGRLPHVLAEAQAVSALWPGECRIEEQATRAAVVERAPRHAILHLAAHGEARLDNPTFAHLKLADGQLGPADVFNLELEGALVTLSACETGRSVVASGDELVGLSRGFLYAGATTLVQSLWRVEDGSTARLMERFYRALGEGRPKGAALREAQLALLADRGAHPYFWAPFQIVGDSGLL